MSFFSALTFKDLLPFGASLLSAGGSYLSSRAAGRRASADMERYLSFQNALNRNRLQWTVQDAKAAGIHPLAALGNAGGSGFAAPVPSAYAGNPLGEALKVFGKSFGGLYTADDDVGPSGG